MAAAVSHHRYPSSMAPHNSAGLDDEDLLASFASDAFSLESNRDRDLALMASFLQGALPHSASPPDGSHHATAQANAQWIGGGPANSGTPAGSSTGWNGWRADASTSNGAQGSYPAPPPAPSSSFAKDSQASFNANLAGFNSGCPQGFGQPTATPHGTPMSFSHPSLPPASPDLHSFSTSSHSDPRYGTRSVTRNATTFQQQHQQQSQQYQLGNQSMAGCRAPAVSRERIPFGRRSSSLGGLPTAYEGRSGDAMDDEDTGMDCDVDAGMDDGSSDRTADRYASGHGWRGF